jgi:large subunit ribosomal protein L25
MKERLKLRVAPRTQRGNSVRALRRNGIIPGILYGHKISNVAVSVPSPDFMKVFSAAGENTLIDLELEGGEIRTVLIHDVAEDPISHHPLHVDFFAVRLDEKIKTEVPLVFAGDSPAVKELLGTLIKTMHALEVESLPADIPRELTVDISGLKTFDDHMLVKDIEVPDGVEVLTAPDEIVASVQPPRSEEELEELKEAVVEDVTQVEGVADTETAAEAEPAAETPGPTEKGE